MLELAELAKFYTPAEWYALFFVIIAIFFSSRLFNLRYINALFVAQFFAVFNAVPIISGYFSGLVPKYLVFQFIFSESVFLMGIMFAYSIILNQMKLYFQDIDKLVDIKTIYVLIFCSLLFAIFNYIFTPQDGSSRIGYQTNYWYSFIKPIYQISTPASFFISFILILNNRYKISAYILLALNILASIASGSKGAFIMQALTAFLIIRDANAFTNYKFSKFDLIAATSSLIVALVLTLDRLQVSFSDLIYRILLFGEPTLMTYYAPSPTSACENLTTFAKMHRGWARALGDPSAMNIDTLFGYAWNIQYFGTNTFTGPNARFGAYMACNFPGLSIIIGLLVSAIYLSLIAISARSAKRRPGMLVIIYPFCIYSLIASGQDFNILMQDINILLLFIGIGIMSVPKQNSSMVALKAGRG
jgi:hypothetical protein